MRWTEKLGNREFEHRGVPLWTLAVVIELVYQMRKARLAKILVLGLVAIAVRR